ncbi:porin family protein [Xanthobacter dioxanivorans]|uniref:Porin family protein n=1 Tax=Xanthobacter dioxanivorans TaxID=2528964 RepID=A0A974SJ60_9HYPH|nr:outer membrane protein [Xanthobacter dioxanivorans]QRG07450.1 porin family protein [Xanthobacter dioxanivorans]
MKRFLVGAAACAALVAGSISGPAAAADLARAPVAKAPVAIPVPVFSWTGFYIGGNAGYDWGSGQDALAVAGVDPKGWLAGGQVGYNYQFSNNIVAGVEADVQGGDISGGTPAVSSTLDVFGTVRARLGYAFGRVLPYVTGGLAWGNNSIDFAGLGQSQTLTGWTAGAGIEYALTDHWTAKTEYLYTDFGSKFYDSLGANAGATSQTARVGFNYKF